MTDTTSPAIPKNNRIPPTVAVASIPLNIIARMTTATNTTIMMMRLFDTLLGL